MPVFQDLIDWIAADLRTTYAYEASDSVNNCACRGTDPGCCNFPTLETWLAEIFTVVFHVGERHPGWWDTYVVEIVRTADVEEPPTCSICDGFGHGYPGAGPCPLEMADYSAEPDWAL